jgi:membrane associated rhomboid family serine protease
VLPAVYLGSGIAVWLFARGSSHVGASGLVYGLVSYIFVAGLIRRDRRAIAASLLVCFMYGALVWGVLPIERGVSWETHLAAALIGVAMAIALRRLDIPPRNRYSWEDEKDDAANEKDNYADE